MAGKSEHKKVIDNLIDSYRKFNGDKTSPNGADLFIKASTAFQNKSISLSGLNHYLYMVLVFCNENDMFYYFDKFVKARDGTTSFSEPTYYECGVCGKHHPADWNGDCRDDLNRFPLDELDARHGEDGWNEIAIPVEGECTGTYYVTVYRYVECEESATVKVEAADVNEAKEKGIAEAYDGQGVWETEKPVEIKESPHHVTVTKEGGGPIL